MYEVRDDTQVFVEDRTDEMPRSDGCWGVGDNGRDAVLSIVLAVACPVRYEWDGDAVARFRSSCE